MAKTIYTDPLCFNTGTYFLTGNQALARAALVNNVRYFSSYPGSPITEAAEILVKAAGVLPQLHAEFSINEAVAMHGAVGASWSGARSMIAMKHVGMHVCLDPMAYLGYTGVVGGLLLVVGTDPGAKCSTGEFDVRHYNNSIHWIMIEPSNTAEVYEYTKRAFEISEKWEMPVLMIMPRELCDQYGAIECESFLYESESFQFNYSDRYINNGDIAVKHHGDLLLKIKQLEKESARFFKHYRKKDATSVVVSSGCNFLAVSEALKILDIERVSTIKLGMIYPLQSKPLVAALREYNTIYVAEELDGYLYFQILSLMQENDIDSNIKSLNEAFISSGDLSMDKLIRNLSREFSVDYKIPMKHSTVKVPERPGTFCPGCPHRGILYSIRRICKNNDVYGGDIGCSSLPPYYSDWLTCMGSGLGIAHGVATTIKGNGKVYASIGDSTFYHCGLSTIANALTHNSDLTLFILNNKWTAMTGHQALPHTKKNNEMIKNIVESLGVNQIWMVDAYDIKAFRKLLFDTQALLGVKIFIINGECRKKYLQHHDKKTIGGRMSCKIRAEACHQCGECYKGLGCPAIIIKNNVYTIDEDICSKCGVCAQICPNSSISVVKWSKK